MGVDDVNMIYIGNLPVIDNDESEYDTDNAGALAGTYTRGADLEMVTIHNNDADNDGAIHDDEAGTADSFSYTAGGASHTQAVDASITYYATVTEVGGAVHNIEVLVVQTVNGDTFIGDFQNAGHMDNLDIQSIQLTTPHITNAAGHYTTQNIENTTVCFTSGTLIDTPAGPRPVEHLKVGDLVSTADRGALPIRWLANALLARPGRYAPILFSCDALGPQRPTRRLALSPQHRILVRSRIAERMFGASEVLVAARRLLGLPGVSQGLPMCAVRYWHILLDTHELVNANGCWSETLLLGPQAQRWLAPDNMAEIAAIFPELVIGDLPVTTARIIPAGQQQISLARRHLKNAMPLQS